jgi:hypothetical protein
MPPSAYGQDQDDGVSPEVERGAIGAGKQAGIKQLEEVTEYRG